MKTLTCHDCGGTNSFADDGGQYEFCSCHAKSTVAGMMAFVANATNTGKPAKVSPDTPVTNKGTPLKHPDGRPVLAADMVNGAQYEIVGDVLYRVETFEEEDTEDAIAQKQLEARLDEIETQFAVELEKIEATTEAGTAECRKATATAHMRYEMRLTIEEWHHEFRKTVDDVLLAEILLTCATDCLEMAFRQIERRAGRTQRTKIFGQVLGQMANRLVLLGLIDQPMQKTTSGLLGPDGKPWRSGR